MGILNGVKNYFRVKGGANPETIDESRRRFLINSTIGVAGVAAAGIGVNDFIKKNQRDKDNLSYLKEKHKNNIKNLPLVFQSILNNPKADHMLVYLYLEMRNIGKSDFDVNDYIEILTRTGNWKECVLKQETPSTEPLYWFVANYFIYLWRMPLISPGNTVELDLIKRFNISKNSPMYYFDNGIALYLSEQRDRNDDKIKKRKQTEDIFIDSFTAEDDLLRAIFFIAGKSESEVYNYNYSKNKNFNDSDLNETWYLGYLKEIDIKKKNEAFKRFVELEKIKRNQLKIVFTELKKQTDINKLIAAWSCYIYCNGRKTFNVVKNYNKDYEADLIKEEILIPLSKYVPEIGINLSEYNYS